MVAKLFAIAGLCRAYFGEKDWQQLAVVRRMAADLSFPVEVVGCPTVREPDGLALSSRNVYLTPEERAAAPALHRALLAGRDAIDAGERDRRRRAVGDAAPSSTPCPRPRSTTSRSSTPPRLRRWTPWPVRFVCSGPPASGKARLIDNVGATA